MKKTIAVLPGDGIGREITDAVLPIFEELSLPMNYSLGKIGWDCWVNDGDPIPKATWDQIHKSDATLIGAITSKPEQESRQELYCKITNEVPPYVSPLLQLRRGLDLFANVRPCFSVKEQGKYNFCIIRENIEGLYSGFDFDALPDSLRPMLSGNKYWSAQLNEPISCTLRLQSYQGLLRIFEFAMDYAKKNNYSKVTLADKPNVLRKSSAMSRDIFTSVAKKYPDIETNILNVDAVGMYIVSKPESFGVIVAENMFGDILSDVAAGVMGGLGFAPSANIGCCYSYFEPVHGSGPRMLPNTANPSAMFLSLSMLLEHSGYHRHALAIKSAVFNVVTNNTYLTKDLGGTASTNMMAKAIIKEAKKIVDTKNIKQKKSVIDMETTELYRYTAPELSDAMDACSISGYLGNIIPIAGSNKIIGPAYTVQYQPYASKQKKFMPAGNYIDKVPPGSIVIIDNLANMTCSVWGGLLTNFSAVNGIAGTIVNGLVRDYSAICQLNYPVYSLGITAITGKNRVYLASTEEPVCISDVIINMNDMIFADEHGVIVLPKDKVGDILKMAKNIRRNEGNILLEIEAGSTLEAARTKHHYEAPWENKEKEVI